MTNVFILAVVTVVLPIRTLVSVSNVTSVVARMTTLAVRPVLSAAAILSASTVAVPMVKFALSTKVTSEAVWMTTSVVLPSTVIFRVPVIVPAIDPVPLS